MWIRWVSYLPGALGKSQSYTETYPHGGFKRACQDVIDWELGIIAPDLTRNRRPRPSETELSLPNYPARSLQWKSSSSIKYGRLGRLKSTRPHQAASPLT